MTILIGRFIFYIHLLAILLLVFGWLMPQEYLMYHLIFVPITMLHWWTNNNQCILTQLQRRFEKNQFQKKGQGDFIRSLFSAFGINFNDRQLFYVIYGFMILSFSLSLIKMVY